MFPIEKYHFKDFKQTNPDGSESHVVIALSTYAAKTVRGVAKCNASDEFSIKTGKELAAARCDVKVCHKRLRNLSKKRYELAKRISELARYYEEVTQHYNSAAEDLVASHERLAALEAELI